jgi:hypothetical protein
MNGLSRLKPLPRFLAERNTGFSRLRIRSRGPVRNAD